MTINDNFLIISLFNGEDSNFTSRNDSLTFKFNSHARSTTGCARQRKRHSGTGLPDGLRQEGAESERCQGHRGKRGAGDARGQRAEQGAVHPRGPLRELLHQLREELPLPVQQPHTLLPLPDGGKLPGGTGGEKDRGCPAAPERVPAARALQEQPHL